MRIAFIINDLKGGGAERVVSTLAHYIAEKNNHDVFIITIKESVAEYDLHERIKKYSLCSGKLSKGIGKIIFLPILAIELTFLLKKLRITSAISFLVRVNLINITTIWFGNKLPIYISERTITSSEYSGHSLRSLFMKFMVRSLYKKADSIIAISNGVKKGLESLGIYPDIIKVIYNPQNIAKIKSMINQEITIPYPLNKATIVTTGRLSEEKDHKTLLFALQKVRRTMDVNLVIIGKGLKEQELKLLSSDLGIENAVFWIGWQENPFAIMAKCDLFVLTSKYEGFGNVIVEAMACGLPVISTDCPGGPKEILDNGRFGVLVPVNQSDILADEILKLLIDKALLEGYREKSIERSNDFDVSIIGEEYLKVLLN